MSEIKVAIVPEWLTSRGGAELVVDELIKIFPKAQIFTTIFNPKVFPELIDKKPITSYLQKIPFLNRRHQLLLPFLPRAIESLDLSGYDIIISSSSAIGKGIRRPKGSIHLCYCHTPMRYVWQSDVDKRLLKIPFGNLLIKKLKKWDLKRNEDVDYFIANSNFTAQRINKYYDRDSIVIYPPVKMLESNSAYQKEDYYLAISRLVEYKRFDLAIMACEKLGKKLIIAGDGPQYKSLKVMSGENVSFVGRVDNNVKNRLIAKAKAIIFPAEEDFGIVPIEAMSLGTSVIGFNKGGTAESVIDKKTGVLFKKQTVDDLVSAIERFENSTFNTNDLKNQAQKFSNNIFDKKLLELINRIKKENKWT